MFLINTNSVKNGCSFPHEHLPIVPGLKMSFEHNSVRKNIFPSACFCWDSRLSLREMDQNCWWYHWLWGLVLGVFISAIQSI